MEKHFLSDLMKHLQASRLLAGCQFVTILGLIAVVIMMMGKDKIITVIDSDGQTMSLRSKSMSEEILVKQVKYYSREVIEQYFDLDAITAISNRSKLKDIMSLDLQEENFKGQATLVANQQVLEAIQQKYKCNYEWILLPWLSSYEYPIITSFGQIKRIISRDGYKNFEEIKNVKLVWRHLNDRPDPFQQPHDLVLISIEDVDRENSEFRNAINNKNR